MILGFFVWAASCQMPNFENRTEFPWNKFDEKTLIRAQKRCGELYQQSPCVKKFIKTGERDYRVLCSGEKNNG